MNVKNTGFSQVHRVKDAIEILLQNSRAITTFEEISVVNSLDRIIFGIIKSDINLPGFRRSAMDGYAVKAKDTHGASENNPINLKIIGISEIGSNEVFNYQKGTCVRISTGAPVSAEWDAVVKIEDVEVINDNQIEILNSVNVGRNIAREDEDVRKNEILYHGGEIIKPWDIALLTAIGIQTIKVFTKPKIASISTGNELISQAEKLTPGLVYDSNRPAINAWLSKYPVDLVHTDSILDNPEIIKDRLYNLIDSTDLIITTGGTSVGTKDYMAEVINSLGEIWVHGIAIRPGKPVIIGKLTNTTSSTIIISLPGYPLAAFINFQLFVITLLNYWTKISDPWIEYTNIKITHSIPSKAGTRDFVRLKDVNGQAELIRITGAGILSSFTKADYLLEVPEDIEGYAAGQIVQVRKLR
ncbi:MAG: molybdopterin molybdotransferase MoeA [Candidatus Heimdallarchaeota archaeon]|nr:molybdopterin molybdotransferase MoeA [Candidatus Heimdallarchaeota archaeon]MDH5645593.1 molybdopterin molybdotransferase MoeA [Candidatus Heimdallarchaeota archaeon]